MSEEDRYNYSREYLIAKIAIGLGGRVAEELTFGEQHVTTGAENDFQVVTDLARKMVTRWGMSKQLGLVFADYQAGEGAYGLNMRRRADLHSRDLALDAHGEPVLQGGALPPALPMANVESSPATASVGLSLNALVDAEVLSILAEGRAVASHILTEHHAQLQHLAAILMEEESLDRTQFEALIGANPHA
jgi:cell division protease FtsH